MSWIRSNSSLAEVGSHWKRTATSVTATPITTPIATSCTIPLRTGSEPTSTAGYRGDRNPLHARPLLVPRIAKLISRPRRRSRRPPPCWSARSSARTRRRRRRGGSVARPRASPSSSRSAATSTSRACSGRSFASKPDARPRPDRAGAPASRPRGREPRDRSDDRRLADGEDVRVPGAAERFRRARGGRCRRRVDGEQPRHRLRRRRAPRLARRCEALPLPGHRDRARTQSRRTGRSAARSTGSGSPSSARRRCSTTS